MISGIVYTSNSACTAQYTRLLGGALGLPVRAESLAPVINWDKTKEG